MSVFRPGRAERTTALILVLVAVALLLVAWRIPTEEPFIVSGRLWPVLAAGGFVITASWVGVGAFARSGPDTVTPRAAPVATDPEEGALAGEPMSRADRLRVTGIAGDLVLFTWAAPWVGYGIGVFVLVLLAGLLMGGRAHLGRSVATAAGAVVVAVLLFDRVLQIPLPDGVLLPPLLTSIGG